MAKYDAVDQLMALATEKRADRVPNAAPAGRAKSIEILDPLEGPAAASSKRDPETAERASAGTAASSLGARQQEAAAGPSVADRGRQFLQAIRPLLPAVAGAMRLIDHGAVQTAARLLPLLGGAGSSGLPAQTNAEAAEQAQAMRALQASCQALRKDVDAITHRLASSDDLLGRTRTHLERVAAELSGKDTEVRSLADRVRLLSAGLIILLMLIIAQMILLVIMLHK